MRALLKSLMDFLKPSSERYIKTTQGKVGRVESVSRSSVTLSFGSFDGNGEWRIKNTVTISLPDIMIDLTKDQVNEELIKMNSKKRNKVAK